MAASETDLMVLGISDPSALGEVRNGDSMPPIPQIQKISRNGARSGSQEPGEPALRTDVRVRATSSICTQMNSVKKGVNFDSTGVKLLGSARWPFGKMVCAYTGGWIGEMNE